MEKFTVLGIDRLLPLSAAYFSAEWCVFFMRAVAKHLDEYALLGPNMNGTENERSKLRQTCTHWRTKMG